jgi:hypothetical protein
MGDSFTFWTHLSSSASRNGDTPKSCGAVSGIYRDVTTQRPPLYICSKSDGEGVVNAQIPSLVMDALNFTGGDTGSNGTSALWHETKI